MPTINTPFCYELQMRFTQDGQLVENVWHFTDPSGDTDYAGKCTLIAGAADVSMATTFMPRMSNGVTYRECFVRHLGTANPYTATVADSAPQFGDKTSPALPNNVTICASLRSDLAGRSYRGRTYLIGLTEGDVAVNAVTPAELTAWADAIVDMAAAIELAAEVFWVILSLFSNGVPRVTGNVRGVDTVLFTNSTVDSQRRRLPGRGL